MEDESPESVTTGDGSPPPADDDDAEPPNSNEDGKTHVIAQ